MNNFSATIAITPNILQNSGCSYLPRGNYINESSFFTREIKTYLKSENAEQYHTDEPIDIPIVKKMKFKLGKTVVKEFSV